MPNDGYRVAVEIPHTDGTTIHGWLKRVELIMVDRGEWLTLDPEKAWVFNRRRLAERVVSRNPQYRFTVEEVAGKGARAGVRPRIKRKGH